MGRGLGVGEIPASLTAHAALAAIWNPYDLDRTLLPLLLMLCLHNSNSNTPTNFYCTVSKQKHRNTEVLNRNTEVLAVPREPLYDL